MILWINTNAQSPQAALVTDRDNNAPELPRAFVFGDKLELILYLLDGEGAFDPRGGASGYTVRAALGLFGRLPVAFQSEWTPIAGGWRGFLNLNTLEAKELVLGSPSGVPVIFEIELTEPDGVKSTLVQVDVLLRRELIREDTPEPTQIESYIPTKESQRRYVQNRSEISELTGGGATALDGIATRGVEATGTMVAIVTEGTVKHYRLEAGTSEEDPPWTIRPDDYANPGNARVWRLVTPTGAAAMNGHTHIQSTASSTWTIEHNFGYRPAGISVWVEHQGESKYTGCEIVHLTDNVFQVKHRTNQTGVVRCI
jgi:hypothetical protein